MKKDTKSKKDVFKPRLKTYYGHDFEKVLFDPSSNKLNFLTKCCNDNIKCKLRNRSETYSMDSDLKIEFNKLNQRNNLLSKGNSIPSQPSKNSSISKIFSKF